MMQTKKLIMIVSVVAVVSFIAIMSTYYVETTDKSDLDIDVTGEGSVTGEGTYSNGTSVTLTATADYGYYFKGWYQGGNLISTNTSCTIKVQDSTNIKAVFEKQTYTITSSCNYNGGTVSGFGSYKYESTVTLYTTVNDGYVFSSWTENGKTLSNNTSFTYKVTKNSTVTANYSILHDASFVVSKSSSKAPSTLTMASIYNVEIKSRTWTITDDILKTSLYGSSNSTISSFKYSVSTYKAMNITQTITYSDGQKSTSTQTVVINGTKTVSYSWCYQSDDSLTHFLALNDRSASWDLEFDFSWYHSYISDDITRTGTVAMDSLSEYTKPDAYIKSMAAGMTSFTSDLSEIGRVNFVLKFVQSIPYQYDIDGKNTQDYYKYPAETLWEQRGDCEDHAILFASLMRAMGYDVVLIYCTVDGVGHMTAAVDVDGASGNCVIYNNVRYYYAEGTYIVGKQTINDGNVGYVMSGLVVKRIIDV